MRNLKHFSKNLEMPTGGGIGGGGGGDWEAWNEPFQQ